MIVLGGVADQGGRPADVGGQHLGHHDGRRMDAEGQRDLDADRRHEEHHRRVVQHSRRDARNADEAGCDHEGIPPGQAKGLKGQPLENARLAHDGHEDHHRHQQKDDVEINERNGPLETDDPEVSVKAAHEIADSQHGCGAHQGSDRFVQQVKRDEGEDCEKEGWFMQA